MKLLSSKALKWGPTVSCCHWKMVLPTYLVPSEATKNTSETRFKPPNPDKYSPITCSSFQITLQMIFFQYLFWFQKAGKRNISNLQYLIGETTIFVSNFYKSIGLRWKSMMKSLYFLNQPFLLEFDGRNYYLSQYLLHIKCVTEKSRMKSFYFWNQ